MPEPGALRQLDEQIGRLDEAVERQAQSATRHDPQFKREYLRRCHAKAKGVAKVAAARKLAVRLY